MDMATASPDPRSRDARRRVVARWEAAAALLRAAAHPVRLQLLQRLAEGPRCVGDLNELVPVSQPTLSQHMGTLREAGLVACHARANRRCYYLVQPGLVRSLLATLSEDHPREAPTREEVFARMERSRKSEARSRKRTAGKAGSRER